MKQVLKRPGDAYLLQTSWVIIMGLWLTRSHLGWAMWLVGLGLSYAMVNLSYLILRRNSLEIVDHELALYASIFRTKKIDLREIEKFQFDVPTGRIVLKSGTIVEFNAYHVNVNHLRTFMEQHQIPVESL